MANRVPQGKGSKDRTNDRRIYDTNFDGIRWLSKKEPVGGASAPPQRAGHPARGMAAAEGAPGRQTKELAG